MNILLNIENFLMVSSVVTVCIEYIFHGIKKGLIKKECTPNSLRSQPILKLIYVLANND